MAEDDGGVEWLLSRELLRAGSSAPAGEGDVRIWPARAALDVLYLQLRAPSGEALFERLRAWRSATAKEAGMPPYVIFHDATLRQIASTAPTSLSGLGAVSGVGANKLAKWGPAILEVVAG